jgi:hypothetical protein
MLVSLVRMLSSKSLPGKASVSRSVCLSIEKTVNDHLTVCHLP